MGIHISMPRIMCVATLIMINGAITAQAQEATPAEITRPKEDHDAIFTFSLENDLFMGEDDNYTNGVRFAYLSPESTVPRWIEDGANLIPFFASNGHKRWHAAFGQSMFTPSDITVKTFQPNDRPYAGWTYGSVGVISDTGKRLDNLQLTVGVVGPSSLAEQTQDFVHSMVGSNDPQGWRHQLHNEPGIVLTYERKWRGLYEFSPFGLGVDITPTLGGSLGNIYTHAAAGAIVRIGYDLPADYGPPLIQPNLPGSDFFVPNSDFSWYLFTGLEGRAVARNIFLDGNTFQNSHSVDKYPLVGGAQFGLAFIVYDTRIAYTHVLRTKEFERQPRNDAFGAFTISRRF
jgi:lipid A 3-O-deacylase